MASAPCRNPVVQQSTQQTLELMRESLAGPIRRTRFTSAHQVAETLDQLCAMGLVEKFVDEHRITRYRPTGGRIA